jgi:hypothetical protein
LIKGFGTGITGGTDLNVSVLSNSTIANNDKGIVLLDNTRIVNCTVLDNNTGIEVSGVNSR